MTAQQSLSANLNGALQNPPRPLHPPLIRQSAEQGVIAQHWPFLSHALRRYTQRTAEQFSQLAYDHVRAGLIRRTDRQRLSSAADNLGIRDFDAQLLIACAIRQWALDHHGETETAGNLPQLARVDRKQLWGKLVALLTIATALDAFILWVWLG